MEDVIKMNNIKKSFGNVNALREVSCSVGKGEIFGLLGPSGAGKTTIIKILTGQILPTEGEAALFGTDTRNLTEEIYGKIGMVLDNSGLYTRLTCYDNLKLFTELYRLDKAEISEVLAKVQLKEATNQTVSKLSKGMTQRLVLARAIIHHPKLLFLDEPTSGLDPATMLAIHKIIIELKKNGTTIFLTTHNMEEAYKLCDNIALLNEGKIIEYGEPETICRKYNSEKKINILLKNGEILELPNDGSSAEQIGDCFKNNQVETIHSSEPNLETVFISLTGRKLV